MYKSPARNKDREKEGIEVEKIDFVLPWVDGEDKAWLEIKRKFENSGAPMATGDVDANAECRYRDCGLLRYWFRAVEKFAPWVNNIFFVTCGQKPKWLNAANPRLRLVNHCDYIPSDCLPTFHSNTIELNLHRIEELSEHFVLFNDDIFLMRPVSPEFFFRDGKPLIPCDLGIPRWIGCSNTSRIALNNSGVLKISLDVEKFVWRNILKFADFRSLGFSRAVKNVISFAVNRMLILGTFGHIAQSHLKSTLDEIWRVQLGVMERTSRHRFRTDDCVNHWLACGWNMVSGRFCPANEKRRGAYFTACDAEINRICDAIRHPSLPMFCLNDKGTNTDPERNFTIIANAFDELFPDKSSFEL